MFQYNLINNYNAVDNIKIAMDISENVTKINDDEIYSVLEELGISKEKTRRKSSSLSGGEQQRVAIARSILTDSDIIVADEPTGNLDSNTSDEVMGIFKSLAKERNKCVIMVTHNERLAEMCDVIYTLDQENKKIVRT